MKSHAHNWEVFNKYDVYGIAVHLTLAHSMKGLDEEDRAGLIEMHEEEHGKAAAEAEEDRYFTESMRGLRQDTETNRDLVRAADAAQYAREAMPDAATKGPTVTLLNATPDPLGSVAALCAMYQGRVVRSLSEVTDEERRTALADMMKTELNGPLEAVQFHFVLEGVDRAFTHQAVRSRASFFAQESLRFAVAEDWAHEIPLPPSLAGRAEDDPAVRVWRKALVSAEDQYGALIAAGMPAEEARGLLPHAITTRYHWIVDLRTLLAEAGKRTCTQAQFHWRVVFAQIAKALRHYAKYIDRPGGWERDVWQFEHIAGLLRPVCYQKGSCGFMAQFDRGCTIRERVDANAKAGRPSSEWHLDTPYADPDQIKRINPREWAADPGAART